MIILKISPLTRMPVWSSRRATKVQRSGSRRDVVFRPLLLCCVSREPLMRSFWCFHAHDMGGQRCLLASFHFLCCSSRPGASDDISQSTPTLSECDEPCSRRDVSILLLRCGAQ